jgi:hypothetical protein
MIIDAEQERCGGSVIHATCDFLRAREEWRAADRADTASGKKFSDAVYQGGRTPLLFPVGPL